MTNISQSSTFPHLQPELFRPSLQYPSYPYAEMLTRDLGRLSDARRRTAVSPLGSGACAGTTLPLDREGVAADLHLPEITANSVDAVSDRDSIIEFLSAAALAMVHVSRLAEDLILWTGEEFRLLTLSESTTTDAWAKRRQQERSRANSAGVVGSVASALTDGWFTASFPAVSGLLSVANGAFMGL